MAARAYQPGAADQAQWVAQWRALAQRHAMRLPVSVQRHVIAGWDARLGVVEGANRSPVYVANRYAHEAVADFRDARAGAAFDESRIKDHAENYSRLCGAMASVESARGFALSMGVEPPGGGRLSAAGEAARYRCPLWWRRQLRKAWTRAAEDAMRRAGIIRKGRAAYASDEAVAHRTARTNRTRQWMAERVMVNGEGEQLELLDLAKRSLANPALRRGEFMTRLRGFEETAAELGHVALFFTLTAPSAFHAQHAGGGVNAAWEAAGRPTVRAAQQWLRTMWARARAKLARLSVTVYGFRIAEPHHDGTPHWHMVLFVAPHHADTLRTLLAGVWLSEYADEPGAREHRAKCITIEPERGSAAGYLAKYVAKNVDGFGAIGDAEDGETGAPVSDGVQRVAAWASTHGIRQFQQIGGPPVGLWRELRRVREPVPAERIEAARAAADAGRWREFIASVGGIERARRRVRCHRERYARGCSVTAGNQAGLPLVWIERAQPRALDAAGREVFAVTRYGETAPARPCGVVAFGLLGRWASVNTRPHRWRIERKGAPASCAGSPRESSEPVRCALSLSPRAQRASDLGPVAISVRPELEAAEIERAVRALECDRDGAPAGAEGGTYQVPEWIRERAATVSSPENNAERFRRTSRVVNSGN